MVTLRFPDAHSQKIWARQCTKNGWQYSRCNHKHHEVTIASRNSDQLNADIAGAVEGFDAVVVK